MILGSLIHSKNSLIFANELESGKLVMDTAPNSYMNFSGEIEFEDYSKYKDFTKTRLNHMILTRNIHNEKLIRM